MESPAGLAWRQLARERRRLLVAVLGVGFAVLLMLMQLGFRGALFASTVLLHERLDCDLVLIDQQAESISSLRPFSRRRLYEARGVSGVASVSPFYIDLTPVGWRNEQAGATRAIHVVGIDLENPALSVPEVLSQLDRLRAPDVVLFDALSRPEYGPVAERFAREGPLLATVNRRQVTVVGLFNLGTSFAVDGTLVTSEANFLRLFPDRREGLINVGIVRAAPGQDKEQLRTRLEQALPGDVRVLTRAGFLEHEVLYWADATPIGFVFAFGSLMGFIVGAVIVYQVLFADVQDHLPEYATLKAIGFSNGYLSLVVMCQALMLAVLGFVCGAAVSIELYRLTHEATRLPMGLSPTMAAGVFSLTVLMCAGAGLLTLGRLRRADPADVF